MYSFNSGFSRYDEIDALIRGSETKQEVREQKEEILRACARGSITVSQAETLMGLAEEIERLCPRKFETQVLSEAQVEALRSPFDSNRDGLD